uniref:Uncharacterized protein n=1 Tax=Anguilla anguilla TaxID=7936 RepID=A0A0E9TDR1_ANGAN
MKEFQCNRTLYKAFTFTCSLSQADRRWFLKKTQINHFDVSLKFKSSCQNAIV